MNPTKRIHIISFLVALALVFILVAWILRPFVSILAFSIIIAVLLNPIYKRVLRRFKQPALASITTILATLVVVMVPILLFGQVIYNELASLYERYSNGGLVIDQTQIIASLPEQLQSLIQNFSEELNDFVAQLSREVFSSVTKIASNVASFVVAFFIFIFTVYYLLKDGTRIKQALMDVSPFAPHQAEKLFNKLVAAVNGVVKGSFFVALIQGSVATIGYIIFGVPEPFLWGAFTVMASFVPMIGTGLVIVPAVVYLAITGAAPAALGLAIWGAVAVGLSDNFVVPKLIGGSIKLHPILVLLAVVGGLQFFGVLGFLIGPIIMAIFIAMIEMYREEFKDYLSER
ncbi:MAG TPA: AI-2E family transporter [Candidatus Doudnabacteria bacterium]|nr:AI-2E family transporter [Candidatus Doudnabacteria bacterium]